MWYTNYITQVLSVIGKTILFLALYILYTNYITQVNGMGRAITSLAHYTWYTNAITLGINWLCHLLITCDISLIWHTHWMYG